MTYTVYNTDANIQTIWDIVLDNTPEEGAGKYSKNFLKKYPPEHHVSFPVANGWTERQRAMYLLKGWFTEDKLVNGTDYLFLRVDNHETIRVWFAEPANCSFYAMKYSCQKNL